MKKMAGFLGVVMLAAVVDGCLYRRVHEEPIMENGDRVDTAEEEVAREREEAEADRERMEESRAATAAEALESCAPEVCEALARGEVALGMTRAQVMASTGTSDAAWRVREAGPAEIMTPSALSDAPRDVQGELAMVQLRDGRVVTYSYQERQGLRVVRAPEDATPAGRQAALAEMLVREGDDYAAAGDFVRALDRYDRADVISDDPLLDFKVAEALDKQLRPIEALVQYRLFLHRLELEKIRARGEAAAGLAEAIARARERVIILERRER